MTRRRVRELAQHGADQNAPQPSGADRVVARPWGADEDAPRADRDTTALRHADPYLPPTRDADPYLPPTRDADPYLTPGPDADPYLTPPRDADPYLVQPLHADGYDGDSLAVDQYDAKVPAVALSATPSPEVSTTALPVAEGLAEEQASTAGCAAPPTVDEFEAAARLFSFTGETPVQYAAGPAGTAGAADSAEPSSDAGRHDDTDAEGRAPGETRRNAEEANNAHAVPRLRLRASARRLAATSFSAGVLGVVGLLTVAMTLPAEAVAAANGATASTSVALAGDVDGENNGAIQAYVSSGTPTAAPLDRTANYSTATLTQMAGTVGISNTSSAYFSNNANCPVQWPFAVGVPISYGFGWRPGEFHEGVDFTPGAGAHIQAIADGTVRLATEAGGGYGVQVVIDHIVDGAKVSTRYGHMEFGSLQVHTGEQVKVGEYLGRTGNTGHSYGAHTHVEVLLNGVTPIDPLPWLRAHNQC